MQLKDFLIDVQEKKPYLYEMKKIGGKCVFLNGAFCSIYSMRPMICQFYPFELKFDALKNQHVFEFTLECPSINSGPLLDKADFFELFRLANNRLR